MNQARAEKLRQTDEKTSYELPAGMIACAVARKRDAGRQYGQLSLYGGPHGVS